MAVADARRGHRVLKGKKLVSAKGGCVDELLHPVAIETLESEAGAVLLKAVDSNVPHSGRETPTASRLNRVQLPPIAHDEELHRRLRLAVYANHEAAFLRLRDIILHSEDGKSAHGRLILTFVLSAIPPERGWFESRAPAIRATMAACYIWELIDFNLTPYDAEDIIALCAQSDPQSVDPEVNKALARRDILRCDFDQARRRMTFLSPDDSEFTAVQGACIDFLTGNNEMAIAGFEAALKRARQATGRRKLVLEGEAGVFHMLALLRANDAVRRQEAQKLIEAVGFPIHYSERYVATGAVSIMWHLVCGEEETARIAVHALRNRLRDCRCMLDSALFALCELFVGEDIARAHAAENEAAYERAAPHIPLAARIYAEVLSKTAPDGDQWRRRALETGGGSVIAFSEIITVKPAWELAFESLTALFDAPATGKKRGKTAALVVKRLAWFVDLDTYDIAPVEQQAKGEGWSAGKRVSLKRLHEAGFQARLPHEPRSERLALPAPWRGLERHRILVRPQTRSGRPYRASQCF